MDKIIHYIHDINFQLQEITDLVAGKSELIKEKVLNDLRSLDQQLGDLVHDVLEAD